MQGRQTAIARGQAKGWTIEDGGVPRRVFALTREAAVAVRSVAREQGYRGETRRLDERAAGTRGKAEASELFASALDAARKGVGEDEFVGVTTRRTTAVIRLAYQHARMAAGPKAS